MKWRNSKEKEVLSNRCLQEVVLQEDPLSRSALGFPSPCASLWEVSQQHSSPGWRENSPEPSERLIQGSPGAEALPPDAKSLQGALYLCSEEDARDKSVLTGTVWMDTVCHVNLKERLINNIQALKPASFASSVPNA